MDIHHGHSPSLTEEFFKIICSVCSCVPKPMDKGLLDGTDHGTDLPIELNPFQLHLAGS